MRVAIAGSSGLIGTALRASLARDGHEVLRLVRHDAGPGESQWDPVRGTIDRDAVLACDAVVNLAGASIGDRRLTAKYERVVRDSRRHTTALIADTVAQGFEGVYIQAAAMGYYGDRGDEVLTERSRPGGTMLASIASDWEGYADAAFEAGVSTVLARSGLVLAPSGGFAARLLPLAKRGLLGRLGPGRAFHSWISLEDEIRALRFLMETKYSGPVNVVSPHPARDVELIGAMCRAAGRTPGFAVPAWVLEVVIGPAIDDLLASQNARPGVLTRLGFEWHHPRIADAAAWVMSQAGLAPPSNPQP